MNKVVFRQLNKDYAYWTEKRRLGQERGGQVAGLLTHSRDGEVQLNVLFDAGMGTLEAIADFCEDAFWDQPLLIFITHGHVDHHGELMILSEIYCQRRGEDIYDIRPPLHVYATKGTQQHLTRTHWWGYNGGDTLLHRPVRPGAPLQAGIFNITPLAVDHFDGAVIYVVEFELERRHKIVVGWDMTGLPLAEEEIGCLHRPSLALFEATSWKDMAFEIGHTSVEGLVESGFLERVQLRHAPKEEMYGAYLVHYSGWEDPEGMLSDEELKQKFDRTYPHLAPLVRVARRGQHWSFT